MTQTKLREYYTVGSMPLTTFWIINVILAVFYLSLIPFGSQTLEVEK